MKIVFRVDSSLRIGSGHMMRCLSLAKALAATSADITFICRKLPGHGISLITSNGFNVIPLPYSEFDAKAIEHLSTYQQWLGVTHDNEVLQVKAALQGITETIDWLIVDHYSLDSKWETQFKSMSRYLMVIDDLANRPHDCDLLLDQNLYQNMQQRYKKLLPNNCTQLLGPQYALLRDEFIQLRHAAKIRKQLNRVLIFFGGIDQTNETKKAILACVQVSNIQKIDVVVGYANPFREKIKLLAGQYSHVNYHCNIQNMAELMATADLAIGAGGSASWERCSMGLPAVVIPIAENQVELTSVLESTGLIKKMDALQEQTLIGYLQFLTTNLPELEAMSKKCFDIVDGIGAERVVTAMRSIN